MSRALELFNKTNQFNTTGQRYTLEQCHLNFAAGRRLYVLQAEDRFTQYGLIGAAWVDQNCIDHLVLSCRALGLGIEDAFLGHLAQRLVRENASVMLGQLQPTEANLACRQLYSRNGFIQAQDQPDLWFRPLESPFVIPSHIALTTPGEERVAVADPRLRNGKLSQGGEIHAQNNSHFLEPRSEVTVDQGRLSMAKAVR